MSKLLIISITIQSIVVCPVYFNCILILRDNGLFFFRLLEAVMFEKFGMAKA